MSSDVMVIVPARFGGSGGAQKRIAFRRHYPIAGISFNGGGIHCQERLLARLRSGTSEHSSYHRQWRAKVCSHSRGGCSIRRA